MNEINARAKNVPRMLRVRGTSVADEEVVFESAMAFNVEKVIL
jgi:hypothetical protein